MQLRLPGVRERFLVVGWCRDGHTWATGWTVLDSGTWADRAWYERPVRWPEGAQGLAEGSAVTAGAGLAGQRPISWLARTAAARASALPVRAYTSAAVSANLITCSSPCSTARAKVPWTACGPAGESGSLRGRGGGCADSSQRGCRGPGCGRAGRPQSPVQHGKGAQNRVGGGGRVHKHDAFAVPVAQVPDGGGIDQVGQPGPERVG
jgi:hypothetical protein